MLLPLCLGVVLLSGLLVQAMIRLKVLDVPGHRSAHDRPTPKGGGVGVVASFLLGVAAACWLQGDGSHGGVRPLEVGCLLAAVGLLALVSWLDDLYQFRPLFKLSAQAAAAMLVLAGIGPLPGAWLGTAGGFCWLMFVTNAVNFIDGLNGLASGSMAIACLFVGLTATDDVQRDVGCVLAAALVGFLPFNFPNARIFLGDVGSQAASLAVAALGLLRWQDAPPGQMLSNAPLPYDMLAMPLLLAGVLFDVAFTLCRRWRAGERLSQAHRGHLYQVARRSGMPAERIALLHWAFVAWGGLLWLAMTRLGLPETAAMATATLPQLAWVSFVARRARLAAIGRW